MKVATNYCMGHEFKTIRGNTLTITNRTGKRVTLECNICSKDEVLWPTGSITSYVSNLVKGRIPCGCSKSWYPTEIQHKILVERKCKVLGFEFLGWEGEYNKSKTKLKLMDRKYQSEWNTSMIATLLYGNVTRSPKQKSSDVAALFSKSDGDLLTAFHKSPNFNTSFIFRRCTTIKDSKGYYNFWEYKCPVCSNDEYVVGGVCSGWFKTSSDRIQQGVMACRCTNRYRFSRAQRELQIRTVCDKEGLVFLGFTKKERPTVHSTFNWLCMKGHNNRTSISGFLHSGKRCRICAQNHFGYYPYRHNETDFLYLLKFSSDTEVFVKVGRSFNPKQRYYEYKANYTINQLSLIKGTHGEIYDKELHLKDTLLPNLVQPSAPFAGSVEECFTLESLNHPDVISTFNLT